VAWRKTEHSNRARGKLKIGDEKLYLNRRRESCFNTVRHPGNAD
jgi:hypothetical protein